MLLGNGLDENSPSHRVRLKLPSKATHQAVQVQQLAPWTQPVALIRQSPYDAGRQPAGPDGSIRVLPFTVCRGIAARRVERDGRRAAGSSSMHEVRIDEPVAGARGNSQIATRMSQLHAGWTSSSK